ncbi:hypothetical protein DPMN_056200 [Dreissena polymorpha]|uniref:Uncharacterized protein n=1 Tax=Dreissena polymorpha TaxID=45954 RepID=A0A9D4CR93_DREPO|nr:hypothetical protein DPMN_056200 [Dreissena polymorpha]
MATAILRSISGDNTGHEMTGTSSGTRPVTGEQSGHRSMALVNGDRSPVRGTEDKSGPRHRGPVRSPVICHRGRGRSPVKSTGHRSMAPVIGPWHRSTLTGQVTLHGSLTGHRSEIEIDVVLHHRTILPLLSHLHRMLLCRQQIPTIWVDVGHALLYRAVFIPDVDMVVTDHLHAHGDATLGDITPIAADLVLGMAGINVVDKLHVGIVVQTILIGLSNIFFSD